MTHSKRTRKSARLSLTETNETKKIDTPKLYDGFALLPIGRRPFLKGIMGAALVSAAGLGAWGRAAHAQTPSVLPMRGGKITIGWQTNGVFGPIDPHRSTGDSATNLCNSFTVFEALTRQTNEGEIEMWLAQSVTADDDSARVWTIKIKQGVRFHNGREMKAEDVIFSIKRIREPGTIAGGHIGSVESYEKIDDYTVRMVLGAPRSWFPTGLCDTYSSMVPVDFDPQNPVGTGPFKIGRLVVRESLQIVRNEDYHGEQAFLDEVELRPFEDDAAMIGALQTGQIDVINQLDPSLVEEIEAAGNFRIYSSPTGKLYPIQMRTDVAPFDDVRLRQALRLVIDRETVLNSVYNGYGQIGNDLYGRYDPDYAADLVRERDVAQAKALVEEAGLVGTKLELVMFDDVATALVLAENAKEISIDITVRQLDGASFFNEEYLERAFFGGDYWPSGPYFLISSLADAPGAGLDQIRWRDEEYLALWDEVSRTLDPDKRKAMTHRLQEILFERGGWIVPIYIHEVGAYRDGIVGFPESDQTGAGLLRALPFIGFDKV